MTYQPHFDSSKSFDDALYPHPSSPEGRKLLEDSAAARAAAWAESEGLHKVLKPVEDGSGKESASD